MQRTFDRVYAEDWRSLNFLLTADPVVQASYRPRSYTWRTDQWLDQGQEGACVGFSFSHELLGAPQKVRGVNDEYARSLYQEARAIDRANGYNLSEGATIQAGADACLKEGFYASYHWAMNAEEVARGIAYFGPCVLGINWYRGMSLPDSNGWIRPDGPLDGGHAIVAHGVKVVPKKWTPWKTRTWRDIDFDKSYIRLHNSWGKDWGDNGRCRLSLTHLDVLLKQNGDCCFPKRTDLRAA